MSPTAFRSALLSATICGAQLIAAQWQDWQNQYPYPGHRVYPYLMHRTADNNLLLCAALLGPWTLGGGIPFEDYPIGIYLVKVQPDGDTLWTKRIDYIRPSWITNVVDLADGNMLITGTAQGNSPFSTCTFGSINGPAAQIFALKMTPQGLVLWWDQYDQPCDRAMVDAWESSAQQIHLLALNTQQPYPGMDMPPTWFENYTLSATGDPLGMEVIQQDEPFYYTNVGGPGHGSDRYVVASVLDTVGNDHLELQLCKLDEEGTLLGSTTITDTAFKNPKRIIPTTDHGLLMIATSDYSSSRVLHTDTLGTILWDRTYAERMEDAMALPDGTYLTAGTAGSFSDPDRRQLCVTRLASNGDSLWSRFYGDSINDLGMSILQAPGGFVAYGVKDYYSSWVPPKLFIPRDTVGLYLGTDEHTATLFGLSVYPDPATDRVNVVFVSEEEAPDELVLFDTVGRSLRRIGLAHPLREVSIDVGGLSSGHYLVVANSREAKRFGRFMVDH